MVFTIATGKRSLTLDSPVMPAAGTIGFSDEYRGLLDLQKLGALVTNPVSLAPRSAASGTRVVPLMGGVLVHTGLPNPGLTKVIETHRGAWERLGIPIIVHLVAADPDEIRRAVERMEEVDSIAAVELGINDDTPPREVTLLTRAASDRAEKPILARVPFAGAEQAVFAAADGGADAVVVCGPPRGTVRDAGGRLVAGRLFGPAYKPLILRLVGQIARTVKIPVIGAGAIHSTQDARDYIEAGARAVQVDSATWVKPKLLETIARDLGGLVLTQPSGALADEWHEGMGKTEANQRVDVDQQQRIPKPKP